MSKGFIPVAKPNIGVKERRAVDRVLRSGMLAQGPEVAAFESEFSEKVVDGRPCVAVNSGTSAQHLGLLASGVRPGDEVIVPSFTFAATANAVALTGATPVFADISSDTHCVNPESIEAAITPRTVGIMPVHLYGHPAPMTEIMDLAAKHHLAVFEDAAQAHLAKLGGKRVGTFGAFAMFSFYPTKNMTSGEGGMVVCEDESLARTVRLLRNQGMERQYENEVVGFNNRMTDVHAAIGRVQLRQLDKWTARRQANAAFLSKHLPASVTPHTAPTAEHVYHQYTIQVQGDRDHIARDLRERYGVGTGVYYPTPSHLLKSLEHYPRANELPHTRAASQSVLSLPVHPQLSRADLNRIVKAVAERIGAIP